MVISEDVKSMQLEAEDVINCLLVKVERSLHGDVKNEQWFIGMKFMDSYVSCPA